MKPLTVSSTIQGELSLSLGEARLSAWELSQLAVGDIVISNRELGYPGIILFNHLPIGFGELVALEGTAGVRVVDSEFLPPFGVLPGRHEALTEFVPVEISLGSVTLNFEDLDGLSPGSYINLGVVLETPTRALLIAAGRLVAEGTILALLDEASVGLRVDRCVRGFPKAKTPRQSGNLVSESQLKNCYGYDLSRSDRFSLHQLQRITELHDGLGDSLALPGVDQVGLVWGAAEQASLVDWTLQAHQAGLSQLHVFFQQSVRGEARPERPLKLLLETGDCNRAISPTMRNLLEDQYDQSGAYQLRRALVFGRPELFQTLSPPALSDSLNAAWRRLFELGLLCGPKQEPLGELAPSLQDQEMAVALPLCNPGDKKMMLLLVYPYALLEPYLRILGS